MYDFFKYLNSPVLRPAAGGEPRVLAVLPEPEDGEDEHEAVEAEHDQDGRIEVIL